MVQKLISKRGNRLIVALTLICAFLASMLIQSTDMKTVSAKTKVSKNVASSQCFHEGAYVIQLTWYNQSAKLMKLDEATVTFENNSTATVYFSSLAKTGMKDEALLNAIAKEFSRQTSQANSCFNKKYTAVVSNYVNIGNDIEGALKKLYGDKSKYWVFTTLLPELTDTVKNTYAKQAFNDNDVVLYSEISKYLSDKDIKEFAKLAYEQKKDYFNIYAQRLSANDIKEYIAKAYTDNNTKAFLQLKGYLTINEAKEYLQKAIDDNKTNFINMTTDKLKIKEIKSFIDKTYKKGNLDAFAKLIKKLKFKDIAKYIKKAKNDGKLDFVNKLLDL